MDLGDEADRLIVVVSGEMMVYSVDETQLKTDTCALGPGDYLGDFALLGIVRACMWVGRRGRKEMEG